MNVKRRPNRFAGAAAIVTACLLSIASFHGSSSASVDTSTSGSSNVSSTTDAVPTPTGPTTAATSPPPSSSPDSSNVDPSAPPVAPGAWIAFQRTDDILLIRPDGSDATPFDVLGPRPHHPDWSPDGTRLAYVVDDTDGTADIWIAAIDGSGARRVVDCVHPCQFAEDPTWSPDGQRLAYWTSGDTEPPLKQVLVIDIATGRTVSVVDDGFLTGPVNPKFSPDGTHLALEVGTFVRQGSSFELTASDIAIADVTTPTATIVHITNGMLAGYPDWSPDGREIVFQAGNTDPFGLTGTPTDLYTIRPDGTGLTKITHTEPTGPWPALPDWTSDASMPLLATVIDTTGFVLASVDLSTGALRPLEDSHGPIRGAHPRRSPVG